MPRFPILPALLLLLLGGLPASGCRAPEADPAGSGLPFYSASQRAFPSDSSTREAALALLRTLDTKALSTAFDHLSSYRYTTHTRTEQLRPSGAVAAFEAHTARHEARGLEVLARRDSGTFDFGLLGRFVTPDHALDTVTTHTGALMLPDEPAYRSPRYREAYAYALHADTSRWNRPVRILEVRARPNAEGDLLIRYARFYVDSATQMLIGLDLLRAADIWLFDEASRFTLRLRPTPCGAWVPHLARFRTRLRLPLRPSRQFRTTTRYFDYAPLPLRPTPLHKGL